MRRGEVWLVNLDPTIRAEIKKTRPAVIVSRDAMGKLPLKIIVPVTAWDEKFIQADWHVQLKAGKENGLTKDSSVDTFQVRSISKIRLVGKLGKLVEEDMIRIDNGLRISLNLE